MEIKRRGFLGAVIGTLLLGKKAFTAQRPVYKTPEVSSDNIAHKRRAFDLSDNKLKHFRGIYTLDTGEEIAAPPIVKIVKLRTKFGHVYRIDLHFDDIKITRNEIKVIKFSIIDDLGYLFSKNEIDPPAYVGISDILRLFYTLDLNF